MAMGIVHVQALVDGIRDGLRSARVSRECVALLLRFQGAALEFPLIGWCWKV